MRKKFLCDSLRQSMANEIVPGDIWEEVKNDPSHFYLILGYEGNRVYLERLSNGEGASREKSRVISIGIVRPPTRRESRKLL